MSSHLHPVVLLYLLMSSAFSEMLSVSQHGPRVLIAKTYGIPVTLICEDHETKRIDVSGISLFKSKRMVEANQVYPGIHAQSQSECLQTFHLFNAHVPTECQLSFSGRTIPSDVMIITVYRCVTSDLQHKFVHTRVAETGDLLLACKYGHVIDILDIKLNDTELNEQDEEAKKQQCAKKMVQVSPAPPKLQNPDPKQSVVCTVARQGKTGNLMVKYQCLQVPQKYRDKQKTSQKARKKSLVLKKNRLRR